MNVLLLENEGPRPLYRRKLERKLATWTGPSTKGRLHVWQSPGAKAGFGTLEQRQQLAAAIAEHQIDVLIAGPAYPARDGRGRNPPTGPRLHAARPDRARTLQRPLHVLLLHHENRGGHVSGAWEGAGDTLSTSRPKGTARPGSYFQKPASFALAQAERSTCSGPTAKASRSRSATSSTTTRGRPVVAYVRKNPGNGWRKVAEATPGSNTATPKRRPRPALSARGLVNVVKVDGVLQAVDQSSSARRRSSHTADDPTITHLRPGSGAGGVRGLRLPRVKRDGSTASCVSPIGAQGVGAAASPAEFEHEKCWSRNGAEDAEA